MFITKSNGGKEGRNASIMYIYVAANIWDGGEDVVIDRGHKTSPFETSGMEDNHRYLSPITSISRTHRTQP